MAKDTTKVVFDLPSDLDNHYGEIAQYLKIPKTSVYKVCLYLLDYIMRGKK